MKIVNLVVLAIVLQFPGMAQTGGIVVPPRFGSSEAPSYTMIPFGRRGTFRVQLLYQGFYFNRSGFRASGICFRPDENGDTRGRGKQLEMEMRVGSKGPNIENLSEYFSRNRPATWATAIRRKKISLPPQKPGKGPLPFDMVFKFDKPVSFDASSGSLFVEIIVYGQPGSGHSCDAVYLDASRKEEYGPKGCRTSKGMVPRIHCKTISVMWGKPFVVEIYQVLPGRLTVLLLGTKGNGSWAGLNLPLDLTLFGAPGCYLSVNPLIWDYEMSDRSGTARFTFHVPGTSAFLGLWVYSQGFSRDENANAMGFVFTSGYKFRISGPEAIGRVYAPNLNLSKGFAQVGIGPVTKFIVP